MTPAALIDGLEDTWNGTIETCRDLSDEEWSLETGCPGWTVKDHVSHLAGIEATLLGRPEPDHALPDFPHVRSDLGRMLEVAVDVRRSRPGKDVLAEFEQLAAERLAQLRATADDAFEGEMRGLFGGTMKGRDLLGIRVFDCWCHEQDIRRAVGRRGGLTGPAAAMLLPRISRGLARAASTTAVLPPGATVAFRIGAPLSASFTIIAGEDGKGTVADGAAADATATIELDPDNFVALVGGRADARPDAAHISGDGGIGRRVLDHMGMTP